MKNDQPFSHLKKEILVTEDSNSVKLFLLRLEKGSGTARLYSLMPGLELVFLEISAFRYSPRVDHFENIVEMNICYDGFAQCLTENSQLIETYRGQTLIWSSQLHRHDIVFPEGKYQGIVLEIKPERLLPYWERWMPEAGDGLRRLLTLSQEAPLIPLSVSSEAILLVVRQLYSQEVPSGAFCRIKALELLYLLSQRVNSGVAVNLNKEKLRQTVRNRVLSALQGESIDSLANALGLGVSTLKKQFKDRYGISVGRYCKLVRFEYAAHLLRKSDISVGQIAERLGYKNFGKFSSAFKSIYSLTPSEYRKKQTELYPVE